MKLTEIKDILAAIIGGADDLKPVIKLGVKAVREYTEDIKPVIDDLSDYMIDTKLRQIKRIGENGYTRDEAIQIVNNVIKDIAQGMKRAK